MTFEQTLCPLVGRSCRYDTTKCLWQMGLTDDECFDLMCLLDDEFYTNFIDMELNIFQAMGFYNIAVYINHQQ